MTRIPFINNGFYISPGMVIDGNITSEVTGVIAGIVNGDVQVKSKLVVEKTGEVNGHIKSKSLLLKGTIKGNIYCEGKVCAEKNAVVTGNIFAAESIIDKDSIIKGVITQLNTQGPAKSQTSAKYLQAEKETKNNTPAIIVSEQIKPEEPPQNWF
jgi:cytoskeletal protein CcmA (bactofilin family)